jgi:hypothetical protein
MVKSFSGPDCPARSYHMRPTLTEEVPGMGLEMYSFYWPPVTGEDTVSVTIMMRVEYDMENIPMLDARKTGRIIEKITRHGQK